MSAAPTPHASAQAHSGEMLSLNCAAIEWALSQDVSSASASRLLIEIARYSTGGRCARTQRDLSAACKLSERQTRTLLAALVADGAVKRHRNGGTGAGRSPDSFELVGYMELSAICRQPAIPADSQNGNRQSLPEAEPCNGQSSPLAGEQPAMDDRKKLPLGATGNTAPTPPSITTTLSEQDNPDRPELVLDGGLGETKPKRSKPAGRKRPRREKFYATEETMPTAPNAEMGAYAASKHLLNGTREEQFGKFRRWHIREGTLIASLEQRWETWVDNWAKNNPQKPMGSAPAGCIVTGRNPDGSPIYGRDRSRDRYS